MLLISCLSIRFLCAKFRLDVEEKKYALLYTTTLIDTDNSERRREASDLPEFLLEIYMFIQLYIKTKNKK